MPSLQKVLYCALSAIVGFLSGSALAWGAYLWVDLLARAIAFAPIISLACPAC